MISNEILVTGFKDNMELLAKKTGLVFDGGDDNRLFADDEKRIDVYAPALGYNFYRIMETRIKKFNIKRGKYMVAAWNDVSGWKYWKNEGGCNYIQITAYINDTQLTDIEIAQLKRDIDNMYDEFYKYHTIDEYCESLIKRGNMI